MSRLNRMFPVIELVLDPQFRAEQVATLMTTTAVAHPVDTALVVMVTVIEAHPVVATMMMTVDVIDLLPESVAQLMIILPHVVGSRILTVVTTHPIHMLADLLMIDLHRETIHQEMQHTSMMLLLAADTK
jgi:hypothetical protein